MVISVFGITYENSLFVGLKLVLAGKWGYWKEEAEFIGIGDWARVGRCSLFSSTRTMPVSIVIDGSCPGGEFGGKKNITF
jgi:hypothetical protein